jgi:hypothetical protein
MRGRNSYLNICFLILTFPFTLQAQNKIEGNLQYQFFVDPKGDGKKIQVEQILKKVGQSDCLIEFIFMNGRQEIKHQDKCSLSPLPLNDITLCKAEIVGMGQVETIEYITGVGVSGIQSRKKLIFDSVNNKVIVIHYAEGGASGLEEAKKLEEGKYLLPLLEASYILPGFQGYGPSQYSGYVVEFSEKGIEVTHILNPIAKVDSGSEKDIKSIRNSEWCKFFYKDQMKEYQEALKTGKISKEGKTEIQQLIVKTNRFCNVK